eukprot:gene3268-5711_t
MQKSKLHTTLTEKVDWIHKIHPFSCPKNFSKSKKHVYTAVTQNTILLSFISQTIVNIIGSPSACCSDFEPIYDEVLRLQNRILSDPHSLIIAVIYFKRFSEHNKIYFSQLTNIFSASLMLAMKMNEDKFYTNKTFYTRFQIEDISLKQFNEIEKNILTQLDYRLNKSYQMKFKTQLN